MLVRKIAVLAEEEDASKALCAALLNCCMRSGAYYEFDPYGSASALPPGYAGCVIRGPSALKDVAALRAGDAAYPIVVLTRDRETCVACYEYQRVSCVAEDDLSAVMPRLMK